jgi:hypothetical protein
MMEEEIGPTFTWFRVFACNLKPRDMIAYKNHLVTIFKVESDKMAHVEIINGGDHEVLHFGALQMIEGFRPA